MADIEFRAVVRREPKPGERLCPTCNGVGLYLRLDGKYIEHCLDCYNGYQEQCECGGWKPRGGFHHGCAVDGERRWLEQQQREDEVWVALEPIPWYEVEECVEWPGCDEQPLFESVEDAVEHLDRDRGDGQQWEPPRLAPCHWRSDAPVQLVDEVAETLAGGMYEDWQLGIEATADLQRVLSEWEGRYPDEFIRWEVTPGKRVDLTGFPAPGTAEQEGAEQEQEGAEQEQERQ
jgi:hypothetical protein